jgi:ATP-dependent DNA helicase RecG
VRYQGKTKSVIRDDKIKYGPLIKQYYQAIEWLREKIEVGYTIEGTGPSKENWEIPKEVFKEAIINALSHRDYYEKGACIMLEVYDNRVEISHPGKLLSAITPSQFGTNHYH